MLFFQQQLQDGEVIEETNNIDKSNNLEGEQVDEIIETYHPMRRDPPWLPHSRRHSRHHHRHHRPRHHEAMRSHRKPWEPETGEYPSYNE